MKSLRKGPNTSPPQAKDHPIEYIHRHIGYNYRLPNILAAMGVAQMEVLDDFISVKRRIASTYEAALKSVAGIDCMNEASWAFSTYWMYTVLVEEEQYGLDSRQLLNRLAEQGIQARPLWQPLHLSKAHENCRSYHCTCSENLYRKALSLPCSVGPHSRRAGGRLCEHSRMSAMTNLTGRVRCPSKHCRNSRTYRAHLQDKTASCGSHDRWFVHK